MFERIEATVTRFAAGIAIIGGMGLLFAIFVTCLSVALRAMRRLADQFFDSASIGAAAPWFRSILGEEELVTFGVGFAIFAALPWVMLQKGHITVDLFKRAFGDRLNRVLDLLGDVAITVIALLILTRQWNLIFKSPRRSQETFFDLVWSGDFTAAFGRLNDAEESQILAIPLWPTYVVAQLCIAAFLLVGLFCVWRSARRLMATS
ncbi:MAG: TRAP transporter small permease subunit [Pseudomonadota bacterium]